ncbi:structural protein MipA [Halomonas sp. 1513]|nr:MipA/OmpV family protein [Halomonas sp. 1513]APX92349.1 structural protein MipA [Halomonas sp. 1513]
MAMRGWWLGLVAGLVATSAMAENPWQGSVGAGVLVTPEYLGSDDFRTRGWPSLELRYADAFYFNPREGLGWNAIREGNWVVSPYLGYTFGRDNRGALAAFEEVDGGATLGLRVSYDQGPWRYSLSGESPVSGDVNGSEWQARASWRAPLSERTFVTLGPSVSYSSASWTRAMFGVSAEDSARSGVAAYEPDSGYLRYGLSGTLSHALTPAWSLTALAGVTYLTGDAADSPIVDDVGDALQPVAGVFLSYRF